MKSFKTRIETAFVEWLNTGKAGTVLDPVPIVFGDSEEKRPDFFAVVYADTDRNMEGVPPKFKNRETVVKIALYHNANDVSADVHQERFRVLVELLEDADAVAEAIAKQDIQLYASDFDAEDDVSTKEDFVNFVAYRIRGVDNPLVAEPEEEPAP